MFCNLSIFSYGFRHFRHVLPGFDPSFFPVFSGCHGSRGVSWRPVEAMDLNRRFAVGMHRILRLAERAGAVASMLTPTHEPLGIRTWANLDELGIFHLTNG
jgi:hypothetical protein